MCNFIFIRSGDKIIHILWVPCEYGNDIVRRYKNDDIEMYNFDFIIWLKVT